MINNSIDTSSCFAPVSVLRAGVGPQHVGHRVSQSCRQRTDHEHHPVPDHDLQSDAGNHQGTDDITAHLPITNHLT